MPKSAVAQALAEQLGSYQCPHCPMVCTSRSGLKQHEASDHLVLSSDDSDNEAEAQRFKKVVHPTLNGVPVDEQGFALPEHVNAPKRDELDPANPWSPFNNRLHFDFAHHHYVEAQSSAEKIKTALDHWYASKIEATGTSDCERPPWQNAEQLHKTIDEIQQGHAPFRTVQLKYTGPRPDTGDAPSWMDKTYELCYRDTHEVVRQQLATPDFASEFDEAPYQQFNGSGERVWSNLMSGDWAWRQADTITASVANTKGVMLVPIVSGLDKTTVSVSTGHQEYHPFYVSPGNLTNVARRGHGNGVMPVAFLPIPKGEKKTKAYQRFARQLYHACIAHIFEPLRAGMSKPEIVRCPDGHFRRAIYSIGPVIADYPEQVWLTGIVQSWCPKCRARPEDLDDPSAGRRTHEKTDFLIQTLSPTQLWEKHGIRDDVVPFTHSFPRADIHELIAPDLLHQVIKGTFKDHLVEWIMEYLHHKYGEARALQIIAEIDRRISAVPVFPGLRRFEDGRDFAQWTGDDSKALMKVYLAAIVGYVPAKVVQCLASFLEICYIFRRNAITASALDVATKELANFHALRKVFVDTGTRTHTSLPRQHALSHFPVSIIDFGSPNGLCSSITESRHITAVKEPWRRSSRFNALSQMLVILTRLDKLATLHRLLADRGYLEGSTAFGMALAFALLEEEERLELDSESGDMNTNNGRPLAPPDEEREEERDVGPLPGPRLASSIKLCLTAERHYPRELHELAQHLQEPQFAPAFLKYLFEARHPTRIAAPDVAERITFSGRILVFHSATARFFAPSDACGVGGMQRQTVRCNPNWRGHARRDTVFVTTGDEPGMRGMHIAQLVLLFAFKDTAYDDRTHPCALVNWFNVVGDEPDPMTGMWVVEREEEGDLRPLEVISLATIVRGAHLLPVFGEGRLKADFSHTDALDAFHQYFVNPYIDHHAHELLSM